MKRKSCKVDKVLAQINSLLIQYLGVPERNSQVVTPLTALIGTVLSQNTNDNNSFKAYQNLVTKYQVWEEMADIPLVELEELIRPAGLTTQKASTIKTILNKVFNEKSLSLEFNDVQSISNERLLNTLTAIKGVGTKTAACVLLFSLGRNVCPVDTHVQRVLNRVGVVSENTPEKTFYAILPYLPPKNAHSLHTNLIRLGRTICRPSEMYCGSCPLNKVCNFPEKNLSNVVTFVHKDFMLLDSL